MTYSVRYILLSPCMSSIFLAVIPRPFVFRPLRVSPRPLNDSQSVPPFETIARSAVNQWETVGYEPPGIFANDEAGRELPGVVSFKSILSLLAMVG